MGRIRIFVSSPGDVTMERVCTEKVIDRLKIEFAGSVELEPFFWEHEPMRATASFNDPENIPLTSDFEIVVCILWSRLGTMLSHKFRRGNGEPYPSGTAFELETAVESYLRKKAPDILVYRRIQAVPMPVNNSQDAARCSSQLQSLNEFIQRWFFDDESAFKAAINEYEALGQFEQKLERPLRKLILSYLEKFPSHSASANESGKVSFHGVNPYCGFASYDTADAATFFGRSQAIEDVLTAMRSQAAASRGFTLVHGASGSGKSSLLRAGVLPLLPHKSCIVEGVACWATATLTLGLTEEPLLVDLAKSLQNATILTERSGLSSLPGLRGEQDGGLGLAGQLESNPDNAASLITRALERGALEVQQEEMLPAPPVTKLALLIDQLEQVLTDEIRFPKQQRDAFAKAVATLSRFGDVWVVATLRSDQMGRFSELMPQLAELSQGGQYALLPPTEQDMGLMIRLPARAAGAYFQELADETGRLEDRLLRDVRDAPDGLPMLSYVLHELYAGRELINGRWTLTHERYEQLGCLEGAVTKQAEKRLANFASQYPKVLDPVRQLGRVLATLGKEGDDTPLRRLAPFTLFAEGGSRAALRPLIESLIEGRLLTHTGGGVVFATHEALLRKWDALRQAIASDSGFIRLRARASAAASEWQERHRPRDLLWDRGQRLRDTKDLLAEVGDLDPLERQFVEESHQQVGRRTTRFVAIGAVAVLLAGAIGFALHAEDRARKAELEERQKLAAEQMDLKEQLEKARASLLATAWEDSAMPETEDDDDESEGTMRRSQFAFGALDLLEICRRLLAIDPQYTPALSARMLGLIYEESSGRDSEEREKELQGLYRQWVKNGLPRDTVQDLEAQWKWKNGDHDGAVSIWMTALSNNSNLPDEQRRRLLMRISSHLVSIKAWQRLDTFVTNHWSWENNATAKIRRALARFKLMRLDGAQADYLAAKEGGENLDEVRRLGPEIERVLARKDKLDELTRDLSGAKSQQAAVWLERGYELLLARQYEAARADFAQVSKLLQGKSRVADFLQALCLVRQNATLPKDTVRLVVFSRDHGAFEGWLNSEWPKLNKMLLFDFKVGLSPNDPEQLMLRSKEWNWFAQHHYGLSDADEAIKIEPDHYWARYWKGLHLIGLDEHAKALEEAVILRQLEPRMIYYSEIQAEAEIGLRQFDKALATMEHALNQDPSSYYYHLKAEALRGLKRNEEAELADQKAEAMRRSE